MTRNPPDAFALGLVHYAPDETIRTTVFLELNYRRSPLTAQIFLMQSQLQEEGHLTAGVLSILESRLIALGGVEPTTANISTVRWFKRAIQTSTVSTDVMRVELFVTQDLSAEPSSPQDAWLRRELVIRNMVDHRLINLTDIARYLKTYREVA